VAANIINGRAVRDAILEELGREVERLREQGVHPGLAVVLVGDDPASRQYVGMKAKTCEKLGMRSEVHHLPAATTQAELMRLIDKLNGDRGVHGILVQLPLPDHIDEHAVIGAIAAEKDVDGFHPLNVGKLHIGQDDCLKPCTPSGIIELIRRTGLDMAGKHAVVVGRSNIVGKPVAAMLLREHATVTVCHSRTANLPEVTRQADILVVAAGRPGLIGAEHIKPGAAVIDVGAPTGDVRFEEAAEVAGFITPVPGGVGPMTIAMLMKNTVLAAKAGKGL
jgi:methylenetetrahydrofolate dehydrogenase (NADP+)/methenyltetrahydrofolate cyclohydrolase